MQTQEIFDSGVFAFNEASKPIVVNNTPTTFNYFESNVNNEDEDFVIEEELYTNFKFIITVSIYLQRSFYELISSYMFSYNILSPNANQCNDDYITC